MLSLEAVSYRYAGARAPSLVEVSLVLGPGEVVGLVGANGAGKTTMCLVAAGLAPRATGGALSGQVTVGGRRLADLPPGEVAAVVGIAFASAQLSGICSTVYEEVAFGPMNLGLPRNEIMARTVRALEAVAIPNLAARDPAHLSGGQQQLVVLAGLLAMEPQHLVLDEPTAHLDPVGTGLVGAAITRLAAGGASILIAEQKTDLLAAICGRVVALAQGQVALEGPAESVLADPRLERLGVDPPTSVRLQRLAVAAGVDPSRLEVAA
ncbi:MAG: energy-coupling factor ABC transporter ATP-binding protein [Candidatus Limnocylindria bacterium]